MERSFLGLTLEDRVKNEEIRRKGVTGWAGHVASMNDGRWTREIIECWPCADKRSWGRPPTRWSEDIKRIAANWLLGTQAQHSWKIPSKTYIQLWRQKAGWWWWYSAEWESPSSDQYFVLTPYFSGSDSSCNWILFTTSLHVVAIPWLSSSELRWRDNILSLYLLILFFLSLIWNWQ